MAGGRPRCWAGVGAGWNPAVLSWVRSSEQAGQPTASPVEPGQRQPELAWDPPRRLALRPLLALGSRRPRATRSLATPGKGGLEQALSGLGCCCPNWLPPSPRGIQAEGQRRFRCWEQGTRIKVEPVPPCVGTPDCASRGWTARRLTGVCIERAPRSSSEIWSVLLQLLIVGGNSKELRWRNKGFALGAPGLCHLLGGL